MRTSYGTKGISKELNDKPKLRPKREGQILQYSGLGCRALPGGIEISRVIFKSVNYRYDLLFSFCAQIIPIILVHLETSLEFFFFSTRCMKISSNEN